MQRRRISCREDGDGRARGQHLDLAGRRPGQGGRVALGPPGQEMAAEDQRGAFGQAHDFAGLITVAGFLAAFALSKWGH